MGTNSREKFLRENAILDLIGSLGFSVYPIERKHPSRFFFLLDSTTNLNVQCHKSECLTDDNWFTTFASFEHLEKGLFGVVKAFVVKRLDGWTGEHVVSYTTNPYYGSNSLEEALIRRDLMAGKKKVMPKDE